MPLEELFDTVPEGWDYVTLGQVVKDGGGHIQTGPFGSQLHASDYVDAGIPSIMPTNIGENRIDEEGIARIRQEDAQRLNRFLVREGDIVYSRRGDIEKRALIRAEQQGWLCGTGCLLIRLGNKGPDPLFMSYYLGEPLVRQWLVRHAQGATMPNLNTGILGQVPVLLPPPEEQEEIASILGKLDDKIELNRRMNGTLEALAQAVFKEWFVEKAEEGWETMKVEDALSLTKGVSYKSAELADSEVALVTLKSIKRGGGYRTDGLKPYVGKYKPEQVIMPGELVVAQTDVTQAAEVIGKPALVLADERHTTLVASLDLLILRPKLEHLDQHFFYLLFRTEDFQNHVYGHASGTTVLHLSKQGVPSYEFNAPPPALGKRFAEYVKPLFDRIASNAAESRTLTALRDSLLPKLMRGEVRVKGERSEPIEHQA